MVFLENTFTCSGICEAQTPLQWYLFTNINNGDPTKKNGTCKDEIHDFLDEYG
jgi:hypothetical protein